MICCHTTGIGSAYRLHGLWLQHLLKERFSPPSRLPASVIPAMVFDPLGTQQGRLPPWEVANAVAMDVVITDMEKWQGRSCYELQGPPKSLRGLGDLLC